MVYVLGALLLVLFVFLAMGVRVVKQGFVYTIERLASLSTRAREVLDRLGFSGVHYRVGDGTLGWPEKAPFERIIVTAAAQQVPEPLLEQLADGGRIVIPIGTEKQQMLKAIETRGEQLVSTDLCPCVFVKLIGEAGWPSES